MFAQLRIFSSLCIAYLDQSLHTGERQALCSLLRALPLLNIFQQDIALSLFLAGGASLRSLQDPSSSTRAQTLAFCTGSSQSQPLDYQKSSLNNTETIKISLGPSPKGPLTDVVRGFSAI